MRTISRSEALLGRGRRRRCTRRGSDQYIAIETAKRKPKRSSRRGHPPRPIAHDLIAKNVFTHTEYIKSLEKVVDDPVSAHDKDPLIFDAVARAAITLFQQPLPPAEQQSG